jgi:putative pyruvate formate lyase activating enzyme
MALAGARAREDGFRIESFEPAYLALAREGRLQSRAVEAQGALRECRLCPRECGTHRLDGDRGTCQVARHAVVSSAFPHLGEEDCLRGVRGSGTIFFSGCSLRCSFCQNADISWRVSSEECTAEDLAAIMLALQEGGCHNINLVTPTHVVPQLIEGLALAAGRGLRLPVVYNTGAYDRVETLRLLDGIVDVYMPDFKFWRTETSERYASAPDYPERAREAIREMHRQVGPLRLGGDGLARRGVLVRHLVMPAQVEESAAILRWLAHEISPDTWVNLMGQYRPAWKVGEPDRPGQTRFPEIDRRPRPRELEAAYEAARGAGLWRFDERDRLLLAWG